MILENKSFIERCQNWITKLTLVNSSNTTLLTPYRQEENLRGNKIIGQTNNNQWTTLLCENAVKELLERLGYKNLKSARKLKSSLSGKKYNPDRECDHFVWEVKWRNRTTPWTAWEKILWTPLKYSEVPKLYGKPLKIVTVWYQEWEAKNWFACGNLINPQERGTDELQKILTLFNKLQIEYLGFTDLLKESKLI